MILMSWEWKNPFKILLQPYSSFLSWPEEDIIFAWLRGAMKGTPYSRKWSITKPRPMLLEICESMFCGSGSPVWSGMWPNQGPPLPAGNFRNFSHSSVSIQVIKLFFCISRCDTGTGTTGIILMSIIRLRVQEAWLGMCWILIHGQSTGLCF